MDEAPRGVAVRSRSVDLSFKGRDAVKQRTFVRACCVCSGGHDHRVDGVVPGG